MMNEFPRTLVAIITPFTQDGSVDADAHEHNVRVLSEQGCHGFVVAGSTGEGPYLSASERSQLVRGAKSAAPDAFVMCGINAESVRDAMTQVTMASDAGADAVLPLTPTTLIRGKDSLVEDFYRAVADTSPIPVFIYSNPNVTAYEIPTGSVSALASHPNIAGMKDSGGNPDRLDDITDAIASGFVVYPGASRALLASHRKGAYGAITASANYAYPVVAAAAQGSVDDQDKLDAVIAVVERHGVPGAKAASAAAGLMSSDPRAPLRAVSDDTRDDIAAAVGISQRR